MLMFVLGYTTARHGSLTPSLSFILLHLVSPRTAWPAGSQETQMSLSAIPVQTSYFHILYLLR